jgi:hypothetical protein
LPAYIAALHGCPHRAVNRAPAEDSHAEGNRQAQQVEGRRQSRSRRSRRRQKVPAKKPAGQSSEDSSGQIKAKAAKAPAKASAKASGKRAKVGQGPAKAPPRAARRRKQQKRFGSAAVAPPPNPRPSRCPPNRWPRPSPSRAAARAKEKLVAPEAKPIDLDTKRTRLKNLIALGKERGYLTYAEINDHLPDDLVDAEQIESIISTFNDMAIQVFDEAPPSKTCCSTNRPRPRSMPKKSKKKPSRRCPPSIPNSAAPPTRCACTCARWARSNS